MTQQSSDIKYNYPPISSRQLCTQLDYILDWQDVHNIQERTNVLLKSDEIVYICTNQARLSYSSQVENKVCSWLH